MELEEIVPRQNKGMSTSTLSITIQALTLLASDGVAANSIDRRLAGVEGAACSSSAINSAASISSSTSSHDIKSPPAPSESKIGSSSSQFIKSSSIREQDFAGDLGTLGEEIERGREGESRKLTAANADGELSSELEIREYRAARRVEAGDYLNPAQ